MKKLFALILAGALAAGTLTACGSTAVVAVPQPEESAPPAGEPTQVSTPENSGAAVKTGYYLGTSPSLRFQCSGRQQKRRRRGGRRRPGQPGTGGRDRHR